MSASITSKIPPDPRRSTIFVVNGPLPPAADWECQSDDCTEQAEQLVTISDDAPSDWGAVTLVCDSCQQGIREAVQEVQHGND